MLAKAMALFRKKTKDVAPAPQDPPPFSEAAFLEGFHALLDQKQPERALDFFISQVGDLAASNVHRRIKLNHFRYAARILEGRTSAKHGFEKLRRKIRSINAHLKGIDIPKGAFLDFGCGEHDPVALASAFHFNGFERAIACDLRPPQIPSYSAVSMAEILLNMRAMPSQYLLRGNNLEQFKLQLADVDPQLFAQGDFDAGVRHLEGKIDYRLADLVTLDVEDQTLALTVSFAVLEHVLDPKGVYEWLFRKTKPGGVQFHYIDLADHRSYAGNGKFDKWSFLTSEDGPPNLNRLRAQEHREAFERVGFEIIEEQRTLAQIPPETKARLIQPWRNLSDEEINTIGSRLTLRRPS